LVLLPRSAPNHAQEQSAGLPLARLELHAQEARVTARQDNSEGEREYAVEVVIRETFVIYVDARTAKEAESKARRGEYDTSRSQSAGDRTWKRVTASLSDSLVPRRRGA
jgi:hypothetical protein